MFTFFQRLRRIVLPLCLFAVSAAAQAGALLITIDTRSLAGTGGQLAFDLVDGGAPGNSITLGSFTGDAILGASSAMGGVAGQLPSMVTLSDTAFFSEYLQSLVFGDSLSFIFESSDIASSGFAPDAFSVFVLGTGGLPLGTTTDPTGPTRSSSTTSACPRVCKCFSRRWSLSPRRRRPRVCLSLRVGCS